MSLLLDGGCAIKVPLQGVQALGPHLPVRGQPGVERGQRAWVERVDPALGVDVCGDQTRVAQDAQMLRGPGLAQTQLLDQLPDRPWSLAQQFDHGAAVGIREG
jgi:hypothetical protein